jgi:tetratricopeptide (TPR) repeat protein
MILQWFDARQASKAGAALADTLTTSAARIDSSDVDGANSGPLQDVVARAKYGMSGLQLNFYQRAKLANAFKWRLIENGIAKPVADKVTQYLIVNLLTGQRNDKEASGEPADRPTTGSGDGVAGQKSNSDLDRLFAKGKKLFEERRYPEAFGTWTELLKLSPRHPEALNNAGSALFKMGRYIEAEQHFRSAVAARPEYPEALSNLGNVLRRRGYFAEAETSLRRAIKSKPNFLDAHSDLGSTLMFMGDVHGARSRFRKVLKAKPQHVDAIHGMAQIAAMEGRWEEAISLTDRVLELDPGNVVALAAVAGMRKLTPADAQWLETAEASAASSVESYEESMLRFAIGKYFDDIGEYERAFKSFKRANEILKPAAEPYDRNARARNVKALIQAYPREVFSRPAPGASSSQVPIFVVGMPRSGTSLIDQIICSHPAVKGAQEVDFWHNWVRDEVRVRDGSMDEQLRSKLSDEYLGVLKSRAGGESVRIVDKAPLNSEYLGVILSVFPKARVIYLQRDPVDTCLSCYFQAFPLTANFTFDLSDLAHFYGEHARLVAHWRNVLPPGSILDVPYAELVADPVGWTRKVVDFVGLDWNERTLKFHETQRVVSTASYWQVRQRMYATSVGRWRNYERHVGPLSALHKD